MVWADATAYICLVYGLSRCNGICLVYGPDRCSQKPDIYRCIRDRLGFHAEIRMIFGTVCQLKTSRILAERLCDPSFIVEFYSLVVDYQWKCHANVVFTIKAFWLFGDRFLHMIMTRGGHALFSCRAIDICALQTDPSHWHATLGQSWKPYSQPCVLLALSLNLVVPLPL